jgi:myo-inositol-1(or 4)-monophosphatase
MPELPELLELTKSIATQAGLSLLGSLSDEYKRHAFSSEHPKEIKALADTVLEKEILQSLIPIGFPILSEESGCIPGQQKSKYRFVVDPLDGTFNFIKGLGPCAVSIALWEDQKPIFGVIYSLLDRRLFWGGAGMGSYCDGQPISVSDTSIKAEASICTGFPVRFDVESKTAVQNFMSMVKPYAKVRMLGSAAISLVNVANGAADVYLEQNIMIWDVAAGLAIVEGAGGAYLAEKTGDNWCYKVFASNTNLLAKFADQNTNL